MKTPKRLTYSVTEYAALLKVSRAAVQKQITENKLAGGVTAELVGNTYVITVQR